MGPTDPAPAPHPGGGVAFLLVQLGFHVAQRFGERLGLVERKRNPADRRSHALHLTEAGTAMLARVREVTAAHEADVTAGLSEAERAELATLLRRIADEQGLAAHALPGMNRPGAAPPHEGPADQGLPHEGPSHQSPTAAGAD